MVGSMCSVTSFNSTKQHHGSLYYQFIHADGLFINASRTKDGKPLPVSFSTQDNYNKYLRYAAAYYRDLGIASIRDIDIDKVQAYADYLVSERKSPSTVHDYLAPLCKALQIPMGQIDKPIRYVADFSRGHTPIDNFAKGSPADLNQYLGLRRVELTRLHGNDLQYDQFGTYVFLSRGKGNKQQFQRVLPIYLDSVQRFFDGSDKQIFRKADLDDKYNYHSQRKMLAKVAYQYYVDRIAVDPTYRKQLYRMIAKNWHTLNKKHRNQLEPLSFFDTPYILRDKNRQYALDHGRPVTYDRLVMRAVSVLHLSHWRDNITVDYLLLP